MPLATTQQFPVSLDTTNIGKCSTHGAVSRDTKNTAQCSAVGEENEYFPSAHRPPAIRSWAFVSTLDCEVRACEIMRMVELGRLRRKNVGVGVSESSEVVNWGASIVIDHIQAHAGGGCEIISQELKTLQEHRKQLNIKAVGRVRSKRTT